jgi:hypothetical protein
METTATPATGAVESDTGSAAAQVSKQKFDPSQFDQKDLDSWVESRKEKLKINGQERELTQAELRKLAGLSAASDEKFKGAKQLQNEALELKKAFESKDPVAAMKKLGMDSKEIKATLENKLLELLEDEQLDPKDRELRDLKRKIAEQEAAEKAKKDDEEKSKATLAREKAYQELESGVVDALKEAKMPKSALTLKAVAQHMLEAHRNGVELSPKDAVKLAQEQFHSEIAELLPQLGMDFIKKVLGAKGLAALREESVAEVKRAAEPFPKPQPKPRSDAGKQAKSEPEQMSQDEYFRRLRRGQI